MTTAQSTDLSPARLVDRATISIDQHEGGIAFRNVGELIEFAKLMSVSGVAVPKHLRDNPGACLAVTMQAVEWRSSPFAVANKSYSVNDRIAYEAQMIQAVILQRAPIVGRFSFEYTGEGPTRQCTASVVLSDGSGAVSYTSPMVKDIKVKNSPLWTADVDQQLSYFSGRSLARRYFPDVILGIYADDELRDDGRLPQRINPLHDDIDANFEEIVDDLTRDATLSDIAPEGSGAGGEPPAPASPTEAPAEPAQPNPAPQASPQPAEARKPPSGPRKRQE